MDCVTTLGPAASVQPEGTLAKACSEKRSLTFVAITSAIGSGRRGIEMACRVESCQPRAVEFKTSDEIVMRKSAINCRYSCIATEQIIVLNQLGRIFERMGTERNQRGHFMLFTNERLTR